MEATESTHSGYGQTVPLRRRLTSFGIALLINILLLLGLLTLTPNMPGTKNGKGSLLTFNVNDNPAKKGASKPQAQAAKATKAQIKTKPAEIKPTVEPPILPQTHLPTNFIELSHEDFASTDVSKIQSAAPAAKGAGEGQGGEGDTELAGGSGPHGEPLYAAEWYRRPTQAEIGPYLEKTSASEGNWGEVACQTMPRYHVDNCVALGEAPVGTHLARQIQEAAWQFLVRPPRVGGKVMVGTWVRIRITISGMTRVAR